QRTPAHVGEPEAESPSESAAPSKEPDQRRPPVVPRPDGPGIPRPTTPRPSIPPPVVIRRPTPRLGAKPSPAAVIYPHPPAVAIRRPIGADAGWRPNLSVLRIVPPLPVRIERFRAVHIRAHVAAAHHAIEDSVAVGVPAIKIVLWNRRHALH